MMIIRLLTFSLNCQAAMQMGYWEIVALDTLQYEAEYQSLHQIGAENQGREIGRKLTQVR